MAHDQPPPGRTDPGARRAGPTRVAGRALLATLLVAWPVYILGPQILAPALPLHARLVSHLDGGNHESLRILDDGAQTVELYATATLPRVQCGTTVVAGDAWVVRTSVLHVTQQWLIALALLLALPTRSFATRLRWCAIALPLVLAQQFFTLPVLLAAGIDDVVCSRLHLTGSYAPFPPTVLRAVDAMLQNGGLWLLTAVLLALAWQLAHLQWRSPRTALRHSDLARGKRHHSGIAAFRLLALSQVVLFAAATLSAHGPWLRRALLALLATTVAAYLLVSLAAFGQWPLALQALLGLLATLCPLALLLVVLDLFEEQVPGVSVGVLVGACTVLALLQVVGARGPLAISLTLAGHAVKLALLACAAALLWRGRRVDLGEARLQLRSALVLVIGVAAFTVLAVELVFGWHVPAAVELPGMAAIFVPALAVNLAFWRFDSALAFENPVSALRLPANGTGSRVVATAAARSGPRPAHRLAGGPTRGARVPRAPRDQWRARLPQLQPVREQLPDRRGEHATPHRAPPAGAQCCARRRLSLHVVLQRRLP